MQAISAAAAAAAAAAASSHKAHMDGCPTLHPLPLAAIRPPANRTPRVCPLTRSPRAPVVSYSRQQYTATAAAVQLEAVHSSSSCCTAGSSTQQQQRLYSRQQCTGTAAVIQPAAVHCNSSCCTASASITHNSDTACRCKQH
jgi:hypothetical protein